MTLMSEEIDRHIMNKRKGFTPLEIKISSRRNWASKAFLTGFTLVELLVVIAIIALLMSILMPSLAKVKRQAKAAACMVQLKQWGNILVMYTGAHDGYFMIGPAIPGQAWLGTLRSYYGKQGGLTCCPAATKPILDENGDSTGVRVSLGAWGILQDASRYSFKKGDYGSYGMNNWVQNKLRINDPDYDPLSWRRADVKGGGFVPVFLDSVWVNGLPRSTDEPPEYEDMPWLPRNSMSRFCVNRHEGFINGVFMDWSVRKIGLKQLWLLKWHRLYDLNAPLPAWPPWMVKFKEYDYGY